MAAHTTDLTADETKALISGRTKLHGLVALNGDDSVRYLQLFDVEGTDDVMLGTTTPDVVVPIQASSAGVQSIDLYGIAFFSGCVYALTTTATGNTGPTADALLVFARE